MDDFSTITNASDLCDFVPDGERDSCLEAMNGDLISSGEYSIDEDGHIVFTEIEEGDFTTVDTSSVVIGCKEVDATNYNPLSTVSGVCEYDDAEEEEEEEEAEEEVIILDDDGTTTTTNNNNSLIIGVIALFLIIKILKK